MQFLWNELFKLIYFHFASWRQGMENAKSIKKLQTISPLKVFVFYCKCHRLHIGVGEGEEGGQPWFS